MIDLTFDLLALHTYGGVIKRPLPDEWRAEIRKASRAEGQRVRTGVTRDGAGYACWPDRDDGLTEDERLADSVEKLDAYFAIKTITDSSWEDTVAEANRRGYDVRTSEATAVVPESGLRISALRVELVSRADGRRVIAWHQWSALLALRSALDLAAEQGT